MNWNYNDSKYIIKKLIIYFLISIFIFVINIINTKAISLVDMQDLKSFRISSYSQNFYEAFDNSSNGEHRVVFRDNIDFSYEDYTNYNTIIFNTNISFQGTGLVRQSSDGYINYVVSNYSYITLRPILAVNGTNYMCTIDQPTSLVYCPVPDTYSTSGQLVIQMFYTINLGSVEGITSTLNISGTITRNTTYYYGNYNFNSIASGINDMNESINNSDVSGASSDADNLTNNDAFNDSSGLESVIQLPFNMVSQLSNTCQPITLNIPFINYTATIPCISSIYTEHFNSLYNLIKLVINGFLIYRILLKVYELVHSARQPDEDKLEVIEL